MKKGWQIKTLGDVCEKITQGPNPKYDKATHDDFRVLKTKDLYDDVIHYHSADRISEDVFFTHLRSELKFGDVLLAIVGQGSINKCNVFEGINGKRFIFTRALGLLRPSHDLVNPYFLKNFLQSSVGKEMIDSGIAGTSGQQVVTTTHLKALKIPIPPLAEQQRIVGLLDEAFEGIAKAKANAEKNLQNARALFESHLQSVFTQRGPGWVVTTIDKISTNLDSKRVPITKNVRSSGEYPYYGASGIVDYVADYIFEGDNLLVSEDGANLLARSTPIAFSVSGKYWVNNHAHILHFENMATQRFAEFYLESIKLDGFITGAAQPKLNQKALNSIPIPIPKSVETQAKIVENVELLQEETQHLTAIYERKIAALEELKKSLLHQAFNGEL